MSSDSDVSEEEQLIPPEQSVQKGVRRTLTLLDGVTMIVGVMIGSGIFISPASVLVNSGSVGFSLIVWSVGGVIALSASLCYVELGTMITKSGGDYTYIKEGFGEIPAFLFTFVYTFITRPSGAAIVVTTFGEYISEPFLEVGCKEESKAVVVKLLAALCLGKCGRGKFHERVIILLHLPQVAIPTLEIMRLRKHYYKTLTETSYFICKSTLNKKGSFPLNIASVNVTKSAVSCRFGHIY